MENFKSFIIEYKTASLPPPYAYQFTIKGFRKKEELNIRFIQTYTDREGLSPEEIYEEGFSDKDDFSWNGNIDPAWINVLQDLLGKSSLQKEGEGIHPLHISVTTEDNKKTEGYPENTEAWEYLIQEFTQAIFETSGKEAPLLLGFYRRDKETEQKITMNISFAGRTVECTLNGKSFFFPWEKLQDFMKELYIPDYLQDKASRKEPSGPGLFVDPGDGMWYKAGVGIQGKDVEGRIRKVVELIIDNG